MQESYKARNTKRFISEYEKEFREGMMAMTGIKADYVETLIRAMKNGVTDLTKFNIAYFRGNKVTWLILGEDDFSCFIYDAKQKKYYIAGRDDLEEEFSDSDFLTSLEYILKIE